MRIDAGDFLEAVNEAVNVARLEERKRLVALIRAEAQTARAHITTTTRKIAFQEIADRVELEEWTKEATNG